MRSRRSLTVVLVAVAAQTALILLISGPRLATGFGDPDLYHRYATRIRSGQVPYRDFLVEYPPLALPVFCVPAIVTQGVTAYKVAFAVEMLLIHAVMVGLVARWVTRHEGSAQVPLRLAWLTLVAAILARLIVTKYDAAPMLVGFAATLAWSSGRAGLGGVAAALGVGMKVYPAAPTLVALIAESRRPREERSRGAMAGAATGIVLALGWLALGGIRGVGESIRFQSGRGFEYGSLYSGAQMLAAKILHEPITIARDHSSFSSITRWSSALLPCVFPLQGGAILLVVGVFVRRGMVASIRYQAAAILAFIVTGKVFSPQFLIWLIPYLAILDGPVARRCRWLFLAVCAVTVAAPGAFGFLPRTSLWVILAYNGRNVLILWLTLVLVCGPTSVPDPTREP